MTDQNISSKDENSSGIAAWLKKFLENHPVILKTVKWLVPLFLLVAIIVIAYWSWFVKLPAYIDAPEGQDNGYDALFMFLPVVIIIISIFIIDWLTDISDKSFQTLLELKNERRISEEKLRESLTESGLGHIMDLITYSRKELEIYYEIGRSQQQKSYRNSILAMWIGFLVIASGIALYLVPLPNINQEFLNGNLQILTIGSGVMIEVVGAFFLFMYRESTQKLTYLYDRQNVLYDSLICLEISKEQRGDAEIKRMIVSNILNQASGNIRSPLRKKPKVIQKEKV